MNKKSKSKVVVNYIYNTSYELLKIFAPLITTPYVSRVLGAGGVGIYSYAQSIATYFVLLGSMGTALYGQREIAYVQNDIKKRTETFWEIETFSFFTAIVSTIVFLFCFSNSPENAIVYRILSLEVLANAIDISWFFKGIENFRITVIRNTLIKLTGIALVFIFVKTPEDVPLYTLCVTLPIFLGNLSLWASIKKYTVKIDKNIFKGIPNRIKPILVLFIPQIAIEVYAVLDKTMIGILSSDMDQVGYYTQAQKIIKILLLIVTSLGTVMLPAMSAAFSRHETDKIKKSIQTAFHFVFMVSFALVFGICVTADRFVPFFFGAGYDTVILLMVCISPIIVIIGMSNVIGRQYLLPTKQQSAFTVSVCTGAVVNFCLNVLLIPRWSALGASIATVLAEITVTLVQVWYVRKQLPLKQCLAPFFKYAIMGAIMFAVVWFTGKLFPEGNVYLVLMVLIGIAVYGFELIVSRDPMLWLGISAVRKKLKI